MGARLAPEITLHQNWELRNMLTLSIRKLVLSTEVSFLFKRKQSANVIVRLVTM